mgnify:CR=1 FL=1
MEQTTNEAIVQKNGGARLQKEAPETQRRRKKGPLIIGIIILAVMLAADLGLGWYANSTPKFWPNTHIIGQDVSGLTAEEATVKLEAALPDIGLFIYDMQEEDRFFDASMASDLSDAPPHVIIPLSAVVPQFLRPGGLFLCSGILDRRLEEVQAAIGAAGLEILQVRTMEDWCQITARKV